MVLSLQELNNDTGAVSLSDLAVEQSSRPLYNKGSINAIASQAAVLGDPDQMLDNFRAVSGEISTESKSPTAEAIIKAARDGSYRASEQALVGLLADPTIPFEEKEAAVRGTLGARGVLTSSLEMVGEGAIMEPSGNETPEEESFRINFAETLGQSIDNDKRIQQIINAEIGKRSNGFWSTTGDFLELAVPGTEGFLTANLASEVRGDDDPEAFQNAVKDFLGSGFTKAKLRDFVQAMPSDKRVQFAESLIGYINDAQGTIIQDSNDLIALEFLQVGLQTGYYDDSDAWVDSVFTMLDATGIGAVLSRPLSIAGKGLKNLVRNTKSSTSISQVYKSTNPTKARGAHDAAAASDEVSEALYGTNSTDAVANDLLPEVADDAGSVANKVADPARMEKARRTPDAEVMDFVENSGEIQYWKSEKVGLRTRVVNDFRKAVGLNPRDELSTIVENPDGVSVRMVYGAGDAGYSNPSDAIELAKFSLRNYGITDDNIQLLKRDGSEWRVVEDFSNEVGLYNQKVAAAEDDFGKLGAEYLVAVEHRYKFSPADVVEWNNADVKRNWFDRPTPLRKATGGNLNQHIFDAHSTLDPRITMGATVAVDRAVGLEKTLTNLNTEFTRGYRRIGAERRAKMDEYIRKANDQQLSHNPMKLESEGFTKDEIKMLSQWREIWDNIYWLENADNVKTLRNTGYMVFVDGATDTKLFARPITKGTATKANNNRATFAVYDQATDKVKHLNREEFDKLYADGGTIAALRTPIKAGDEAAEFIVSTEKQGQSYLRGLSDDDEVLTYRQGYYTVYYDDPKFIVQRVRNDAGNVLYEKAVGTARDTAEAELFRRRMIDMNGGRDDDFFVREDVRGERYRGDDAWQTAVAGGRTAQRIRGKRLEDATTTITDIASNNISDPLESLTNSIRSVSRRVAMRDYLETTKQRFLNQFKDVLPEDKFGNPMFPTDRRQIGERGQKNKKLSADARTTFNYIRYMEDGYTNAIDDTYKAALNGIAQALGERGFGVAERAVRRAGEVAPTGAGKNIAFKAYLATNPLRQLIVQSHQSVRLAAQFPKYFLSGRAWPQMAAILLEQRGLPVHKSLAKAAGMSRAEIKQMTAEFKRSGLYAAVDANNLARADMKSMADFTLWGRTKSVLGSPVKLVQKVGFDAGENINIMSAWLAYRDSAVRAGRNLDQEVLDEVAAQARNFTLNMNAAGDLPYNRNALNIMFQFMQVPHKMLTQYTTNRILSRSEKAKLLAYDTAMFGIPAGLVGNYFADFLPEDTATRDAVERGLEHVILNKMLSLASNGETSIDFSGLAPSDMHGMSDTLIEMMTSPPNEWLANSPSGQLLMGNNPRIMNAFKTASRFFGLVDDYEDPTELWQVAHEFAKISSGYSNAYKAGMAMKYGQKFNSTESRVTDHEVNTTEALAQAFGFRTMTEARNQVLSQELYEQSQAFRDDLNTWYTDFSRHLSGASTPEDINRIAKVYSEGFRQFGNSAEVKRQIRQKLVRDFRNGNDLILRKVLRAMEWQDVDETRANIRGSNATDEQKRQLLDTVDYIQNIKEPNG